MATLNQFLISIIEACQLLDAQSGSITDEENTELQSIDATLWSMVEDREED